MKRMLVAWALISGGAVTAGCHGPTTGAEVDRIMAEARQNETLRARRESGSIPMWARSNGPMAESSIDGAGPRQQQP